MYTLHIGNKLYSSWSLRPWILMRELEIDFVEELHPFDDGGSWKKFRSFSPTGKVPCLVDNSDVVWDSLAIIEYLAERHDGIWPTESSARAWARSASAEMHSGFSALRNECSMRCGIKINLHKKSDALDHDISRIDELWAEGFDRFNGPFLAGDAFGAVDAFFAPITIRILSYDLAVCERSMKYVERIYSLASMQEWVEAGINEPWTEPSHENEILASGKVIEDQRRK